MVENLGRVGCPLAQLETGRAEDVLDLTTNLYCFVDCGCSAQEVVHVEVFPNFGGCVILSLGVVKRELLEAARSQIRCAGGAVCDRSQLILADLRFRGLLPENALQSAIVWVYPNLAVHFGDVRHQCNFLQPKPQNNGVQGVLNRWPYHQTVVQRYSRRRLAGPVKNHATFRRGAARLDHRVVREIERGISGVVLRRVYGNHVLEVEVLLHEIDILLFQVGVLL